MIHYIINIFVHFWAQNQKILVKGIKNSLDESLSNFMFYLFIYLVFFYVGFIINN